MTLEDLETRTVVIEHRASGTKDRYGAPIPATTSSTTVDGYYEQTEAVEVVIGQETYTTTGLLVLPAGTPLEAWDRVRVDGDRFEVVGPPARPWRPSTGEHHVEVRLRRSEG